MTWICPNCDRRYPDSSMGVPKGEAADEKNACKLCFDGTTEDRSSIFRQAVRHWGYDAQADMAVEECAELIEALQNRKRERGSRGDVIEELADVRIMYEQLRHYFGPDQVDSEVDEGIKQLRERIDQDDPSSDPTSESEKEAKAITLNPKVGGETLEIYCPECMEPIEGWSDTTGEVFEYRCGCDELQKFEIPGDDNWDTEPQ